MPFSSTKLLTLFVCSPTRIISPFLRVPFWTRIVATAPFPTSVVESNTTPKAGPLWWALSSRTSASKDTASSNSFIPSPLRAEIGKNCVCPPQSSGMSSLFESSVLTFSISASSLSILLTATTIGTPAALAWLIASSVCGCKPSSAATTKITISVEFAPLALTSEKAAWPGVSINAIVPCSVLAW